MPAESVPNSSANEIQPWNDKKKFDAEIQYILLQFEKPKEWADLMNCLSKLHRSIKQSSICEIPQKETICKRLAQCLNPQLPSGIHARALEVYGSILEKTGTDGLAQNLALFSSGLFPFFTYSSSSVRPLFLNLIEQYYMPLGKKLLPCLIGMLICILPGLDDDKSESYEQVYKVLERISDCVSERNYMRALWIILLNASKIRQSTLMVIANKLAPGLPMLPPERVEILVPHRHVLVMKSLEATTDDESLLVLREMINMLIKHFPLDSNILSDSDKSRLCRHCLKLLTKRNWSLNRRLYHWIFNATNDFNTATEALDLDYFTKYSKDILIKAIKDLLMERGKSLDEVLIPIKIIVTFISDSDLKGITDKLMPALCIPILKYICKEREEEEWRANIIESTRLIFDTSLTPTSVIFESIVNEYNKVTTSPHSKCSSVWHDMLELSSVYVDEVSTQLRVEDVLCGMFMLMNNALDHLHKLKINEDLTIINHIIMYVSTIFSRVEAIIRGEGNSIYFYETMNLHEEDEKMMNILAQYQESCNMNISRYLDTFYTNALTYIESHVDELSAYQFKTIDVLNNLAVRFVAVEEYMKIVPITKGLAHDDSFVDDVHGIPIEDLNETYIPDKHVLDSPVLESFRLTTLFRSDSLMSTNSILTPTYPKVSKATPIDGFKLETWMQTLLKCTISNNPQLFCRGIRMFIELLRLPNKSDLFRYVEKNEVHLQSIIMRLWNSLDDTHAANHSEIVLLLIQFNKTIPLSRSAAEKIIVDDLTSADTDLKVTAILRFQVLWRYGHIHAPMDEIFPQAVGCILDNVEESDPKLRYYSCSFLSESVAILPNLINPILRALVSFDKIDPESYSSYIVEVLRKFRHLSYIVSREGPVLLDLMQRCQAPPQLVELVQGQETYNRMLGIISITKDSKKSPRDGMTSSNATQILHQDSLQSALVRGDPLVAFPSISDPQGISYEDACIYDYVDLIVILTLKYICLDIDVSSLLEFTTVEQLVQYAKSTQESQNEHTYVLHENTMLFRCTAIDFMKLFLSTIQPTSRAKEVACLISRPLLCVLYHFHLKDEAIIQTQLLYLFKVVIDRCHVEAQTVSEITTALIDSSRDLARHIFAQNKPRYKLVDTEVIDPRLQELEIAKEDTKDKEKNEDDEKVVLTTYDNKNRWRTSVEARREALSLPEKTSSIQEMHSGDSLSCGRRDLFYNKASTLPKMYILNVVAIKRGHVGKLKKLSEDALFGQILESCILNTAKSNRTHLLQSYIDFSLYTLKYLSGPTELKYSSTFIQHFCNHLSQGKEWIKIATVSQYLRGIHVLLEHITSMSSEFRVDLKNTERFHNEHDGSAYSLSSILSLIETSSPNTEGSDGGRQLFTFGTKSKTVSSTKGDETSAFEISQVVDICIQCLLWVKTHNKPYIASEECTATDGTNSIRTPREAIRSGSNIYKGEMINNDSIRLDIIMALESIYDEILEIFRLLYKLLPYHFAEGCLLLWDKYENTNLSREIKLEMLSCLNAMPMFSRHKMIAFILDMLEPFVKSNNYKNGKGYQLLNCTVRDNSLCEFIYALIDLPMTNKRDVESTFDVMKRFVDLVLHNPRQPMVLLWCFQIICNFDKSHPTKDVNVIGKVMKRMLSDVMYGLIYQSVGLYMHKVCTWLQPKLYDLEPPLPPHIYMINYYYYDHVNPMNSVLAGGGATAAMAAMQNVSNSVPAKSKTVDSMDCVSKNALAQLIVFSYETVQLSRRTAIANVFYHVLWNSLTSYILPMLQDKMEQPLQYRYLVFLLLHNLPFDLYEGSLQCIKRFIVDYINTPDFLKTDRRTFRCMIHIFRQIADDACRGTVDRLIKLDLFTSPPHSSLFTSRNMNIQSRIKYLKRLAFVLYACRNDTFASNIATIIERLTDNCRAFDDDNLRAKTLLVMRVLLIKMSQKYLTVLWPVLLSELIKVFEKENRAVMDTGSSQHNSLTEKGSDSAEEHNQEEAANTGASRYILLKEALKIIDVAYALGLNDFLIYQWMFVNDMADKDYTENDNDLAMGKSAFEFKPFLMIVEQTYPEEVKKHLCNELYLKIRKYIGRHHVEKTEPPQSSLRQEHEASGEVNTMGKQVHERVISTASQDSADRRKVINELIDISIENELMEMDSSLTDQEIQISVHQICKMYRKVT
ncbi:dopey, N-terminal domain containing protein [Babesia divergens]|uniref:Dopey, N-terminal domain containing protein n=1 Tax=Babesia divergens TaxID=32595 RepID=A0AAD9GL04_BABDI|nr:dopey, N-terminal domain containing protein [Babesia divergens]